MKNTKTALAVLAGLISLIMMTSCSEKPERLDGDNTLPVAVTTTTAEQDTEPTVTTVPATSTQESTTKRTAISSDSPELATTTATTSPDETAPPILTTEISSTTIISDPFISNNSSLIVPEETITSVPIDKVMSQTTPTTAINAFTSKSAITRPYSYYQMTTAQKYAYDKIYDAVINYETYASFDESVAVTVDDLAKVYETLLNEQTDIFFVDNTINYYTSPRTNAVTDLSFDYTITKDQAMKMLTTADNKANEIISKITPNMSEYDVVKFFHDEIVVNTSYDLTSENGRNIYGTLGEGVAYCQGYAKTFVYLCNKVGINSMIISGDVGTQPHMWNMVKIDGKWYHIDPTFDDSNRVDHPLLIRYDYFCITDEVLARDRTVTKQSYSYPAATSTDANYFVKNNLVASDTAEAKMIALELIEKAAKNKETSIQFACKDKASYDKISTYLFSAQTSGVSDIYSKANESVSNKFSLTNINYNVNSDTYTIRLFISYTN